MEAPRMLASLHIPRANATGWILTSDYLNASFRNIATANVFTRVNLHFLANLDAEEGNKRGKAYPKISGICREGSLQCETNNRADLDDDSDPCGDADIEWPIEFGDDIGGVQQESGYDFHNERDDDMDTGYNDTSDDTAIDVYSGDDLGRSIDVRHNLSNDGCRVVLTIWGGIATPAFDSSLIITPDYAICVLKWSINGLHSSWRAFRALRRS